ncbi:MAG: transposase [Spirochaetaceae bacterium]|nr:transposase [Spirochaetaceae bacterium]
MNGILKQEYGLAGTFKSKADALKAVDEAVLLFNTKRPHLSLRYETPESRHSAALAA